MKNSSGKKEPNSYGGQERPKKAMSSKVVEQKTSQDVKVKSAMKKNKGKLKKVPGKQV